MLVRGHDSGAGALVGPMESLVIEMASAAGLVALPGGTADDSTARVAERLTSPDREGI